jgi:hypothetical protein
MESAHGCCNWRPAGVPAQQRVRFARLDLEPGASETVGFVVPMS